MTIPFNTNSQSLFPRAGVIFSQSNFLQDLLNANTEEGVGVIAAGYSTAQANLINGLYTAEASFRSSPQSWFQYLQSLLQATVIQMAYDDGTGINPVTLLAALQKVVTQMTGNYHIARPTTTAVVTAGSSNVGNGKLIASLTDADGLPLDYVFGETVTATVTADGYTGGTATAGSEPLTAVGEVAASSIYAYNYPLGSGGSANLTTLNPAATGLLITNGNFANWSGGTPTPDNWTIAVGTAGTTVSQNNAPYLPTSSGAYNLRITGNGSELTKVRTAISLLPNRVYAFGCWMKTDGAVAAGVIAARLVSAATPTGTPTVINNEQSVAQSISQSVPSLTSSYTFVSGFFQTPPVLPSDPTYLELAVTTAITNTEILDISAVGIQLATQLYAGGPWFAAFRGSTNFATGDKFTTAVTTTATITTFARQLDRYLGLRQLGVKIPSSGGTLIPDALVNAFPNAPQGFQASDATGGNVQFNLTNALNGASTYRIYVNGGATYTGITYADFPLTEAIGAGTYNFAIAGEDANNNIGALEYIGGPVTVT